MVPTSLAPDDLAAVDAALERALIAGRAEGLTVLGAGEISVALAWPTDTPVAAVKLASCRAGQPCADEHQQLIDRYCLALADAGVTTVPTIVQCAPSGRSYLVQPLLPPGAVVEQHVRDHPDDAERVIGAIVERVVGAVSPTVGVDPQLANWILDGDGVALLDVGTPMLRDDTGQDQVDLQPYVASTPAVVRPVVRRIGPEILAAYHDRRRALADLGFNLIKVGLDQHCQTVVDLTSPHLDEPLTVAELRRAYRNDARLWQALQAARRADRAWQQRVRRRTYPYLLPPPIDRHLDRRTGRRPG